MITIKSQEEIKIMAEAGKILAKVMEELEKMVKPGITTKDLNKASKSLVLSYGALPAFENYQGFPATLCTSINEVIVHGIPGSVILKEGDIVSLDLGLKYKGYYSDMAITVPVGNVSPEANRLIRIAKKALKRGIKKVRPGIKFGDIGNTIQRYIEDQGFGVIRELCGHGIGKNLHEDPQVLNFGKRNTGSEVKEGMVFCIEPMVSIGDWNIKLAKDKYGYQTKDSSLAAHFEHTIAVTKNGCKILTE